MSFFLLLSFIHISFLMLILYSLTISFLNTSHNYKIFRIVMKIKNTTRFQFHHIYHRNILYNRTCKVYSFSSLRKFIALSQCSDLNQITIQIVKTDYFLSPTVRHQSIDIFYIMLYLNELGFFML